MATIPPDLQRSTFPPPQIAPFDACQPEAIRLYPLSNYTFGTKETQLEEDASVKDRLRRLEEYYKKHGMRRTCEGVLICHEHNHPHVLMLQIANAFFKLPGDHLGPTADELTAFSARLSDRLSPTGSLSSNDPSPRNWNIAHCLAQWYRPNFDTPMYPFLPGHVTRPKECKKLYFIQLPSHKVLAVPKNMKLLAVPLFELYENTQRYGPQLAAIPQYLSRFRWEFVNEEGRVVSYTPGGKVDARVTTKVLVDGGVDADGDVDFGLGYGDDQETNGEAAAGESAAAEGEDNKDKKEVVDMEAAAEAAAQAGG